MDSQAPINTSRIQPIREFAHPFINLLAALNFILSRGIMSGTTSKCSADRKSRVWPIEPGTPPVPAPTGQTPFVMGIPAYPPALLQVPQGGAKCTAVTSHASAMYSETSQAWSSAKSKETMRHRGLCARSTKLKHPCKSLEDEHEETRSSAD